MQPMRGEEERDRRVRLAVYAAFAERGAAPTRADVARATGLAPEAVSPSYARLAAGRVLVLSPESGEVWMAMPFSAVPTAFRVRSGERAWWANCAWDALGVAVATERDVEIETECADCGAALALRTRGAALDAGDAAEAVVHFLVPAAQWWVDIGFT